MPIMPEYMINLLDKRLEDPVNLAREFSDICKGVLSDGKKNVTI
jgi:hypothetical protein